MDWIFPVVVFLVMSAIGLGTWLTSSHLEKKRRQRVIALANELGLELNWSLPPEDQQALAPFEVVQKGSNQHSSLSLVADDGVTRISLFDYSFVIGSGKNQQTHRWVISLCRDERLRAPVMQLKPATFFSRIGSLIGFQDIDIPDAPEFSHAFVVQGKDPEGIRGFLQAVRRNAFLLQPKQIYALRGNHLLIVRENKKLDAPNIKPLLSESLALIRSLTGTSE
jgi:hypothetical protein